MRSQISAVPHGAVVDGRRWLAADTFVIFLFHGVVREARHRVRNYTRKHLPLDHFVAILDRLIEDGTPVSMNQVAEASAARRSLPPRAFAVTFDDGFENNVTVAAPVLADRRVPATFYVTTGFIETNGSSWIDLIEDAVERVETCRIDLALPTLAKRQAHTIEEKQKLLDDIRRVVKSDSAVDPYEVAADLRRQLGFARMEPDPELDQKMTWNQVRTLHNDPLFTIGGHGVTHRILEFLSQDDLEQEIAVSLRTLRQELAEDVAHYSYPEGLATCYSPRVIDALRRRGVVCAPTAEPGTNRIGDDLYQLKRVAIV